MTGPDFVPKERTIIDCSRSKTPLITTDGNHGYYTGQTVMVVIPRNFGMHIEYLERSIDVLSLDTFTINFDNTGMLPFTIPVTHYTPAHCCPVSGTTDNIA